MLQDIQSIRGQDLCTILILLGFKSCSILPLNIRNKGNSMSDYWEQRDALEKLSPSETNVSNERLLAFLEELTLLTRKYKLGIFSEGNIDVCSVRPVSFQEAHSFAYTTFWNIHDQDHDGRKVHATPVEIILTEDRLLRLDVIDIDNI